MRLAIQGGGGKRKRAAIIPGIALVFFFFFDKVGKENIERKGPSVWVCNRGGTMCTYNAGTSINTTQKNAQKAKYLADFLEIACTHNKMYVICPGPTFLFQPHPFPGRQQGEQRQEAAAQRRPRHRRQTSLPPHLEESTISQLGVICTTTVSLVALRCSRRERDEQSQGCHYL